MSTPGYNSGLIEDYYRQYLENPNSVSQSWRDFFANYRPDAPYTNADAVTPAAPAAVPVAVPPAAAATAAPVAAPATNGTMPAPAAPPTGGDGAAAPPSDGSTRTALRGPSGLIAKNMEASLAVPTATSVRQFPVKLMAENRRLLNDHQKLVGGDKVSFTHLIAYAIVQALKVVPNVNTTFERAEENGKETLYHVVPPHVNLGLAIDVERKGKRSLLVPNVKKAETLTFAGFLAGYNDLVRRAKNNTLGPDDFAGTTASITNPGMIGTTMSVPRLMDGQGVIVGVGSIGMPPEFFGMPPEIASKAGMSEVMTLTSTYDHRVIQGAESGQFLDVLVKLLLGDSGFYEDVFRSLGVPYPPFRLTTDTTPFFGGVLGYDDEKATLRKQTNVFQLIRSFRVRGHLQADVNPLGYEFRPHEELDPATYGLSIWDLDRTFMTGGLGGKEEMTLREILDTLRETYTRKVGVEFMHITSAEEKRWLISRIETTRLADPISADEKRRILEKLNAAEAFETYLHTKYVGQKRFSLQGADAAIPFLDAVLTCAADGGVREAAIGMAHRGRLNVLVNVLGKGFDKVFDEFEGNIDPESMHGSGDVKYHLGQRGRHTAPSGQTMKVMLAANPSHLETVDPIIEGMVRARQDILRETEGVSLDAAQDAILPVLIHGDAAFAGQGVVPETLQLSQLRGYKTGGTVHLVINNQIGFTTVPSDSRSTTYATDIARFVEAPIFHVNGDDPEAVVRVARLAYAYREAYNKDVVVDLLCYRVFGHNEGDEPTYTQPVLYRKIQAKRTPRLVYTELLIRRGDVKAEDVEALLGGFKQKLDHAFDERTAPEKHPAAGGSEPIDETPQTAVGEATLRQVLAALGSYPEDFNVHPKLLRQFEQRNASFDQGKILWGLGEALAFGTLMAEGHTVRVTGQDSRRGTFAHRLAVLYDFHTGAEFIPLAHIKDGQGTFYIYDSSLSEYAVSGFEYGYSVERPDALTVWEAQFGDFSNGAQIVFDQYLASGETKWAQQSSLVLLLPHGMEGQGPEHSSARLERFLQLCAEDNMIVANLTTPAQLFHALRRQVLRTEKKPLVVMSPKSLLRLPAAFSTPKDFTDGAFQPVIPSDVEPAKAKRLVFCSGKLAYELLGAATGDVAVARVEQLYPFPAAEVRAEIERYADAEVVWVQEEPQNMGAWTFVQPRMEEILDDLRGGCNRLRYIGRKASASPAVGSHKVHVAEQEALIAEAMGVAEGAPR